MYALTFINNILIMIDKKGCLHDGRDVIGSKNTLS